MIKMIPILSLLMIAQIILAGDPNPAPDQGGLLTNYMRVHKVHLLESTYHCLYTYNSLNENWFLHATQLPISCNLFLDRERATWISNITMSRKVHYLRLQGFQCGKYGDKIQELVSIPTTISIEHPDDIHNNHKCVPGDPPCCQWNSTTLIFVAAHPPPSDQ